MPSISISLWKGETKIWDESPNPRPLRRMPDGRVGVVYRGSVFPLHGQNEVDIDDDSEEPTNCPLVPETVDVSRAWYLDTSGRSTYVVWRGRKSQVPQVLDALREDGIVVKQNGPSKRPASNGINYDWYARIPDGHELSDDDLERTLDPVFQSDVGQIEGDDFVEPNLDLVTVPAEELDRLSRRLEDLEKTVGQARQREEELTALSQAAAQRAKILETKLAAADRSLASLMAENAVERANLQGELASKEQELKASQRPVRRTIGRPTEEEPRQHQAGFGDIVRERDQAVEELTRLKTGHLALEGRHQSCGPLLEDVGMENSALKAKNDELERALNSEQSKSRNYKNEATSWRVRAQVTNPQVNKLIVWVKQTLVVFAPTVQFIEGGDSYIHGLSELRSLFAILREIESGTAKGVHVEGTDGWSEKHFNTGAKDDGRIYWFQGGPRSYIYVGDKDTQAGDIGRLCRWRPPR